MPSPIASYYALLGYIPGRSPSAEGKHEWIGGWGVGVWSGRRGGKRDYGQDVLYEKRINQEQ